jgi:hypothetical protein
MTETLIDSLHELANNMDYWNDIKFNKNFLAEIGGWGIS